MELSTILLSIGTSLGGSVGITLIFIKVFGNKLLESQFAKSLENYKYKINSRFDRVSKIHEKEFEILPKIWDCIIETNTSFYSLTSLLQQNPDINRMTDLERRELYAEFKFRESEIIKIESAVDKFRIFTEIDYWRKYNKINKAMIEFSKTYMKNRIFLVDEVGKNIETIRLIFIDMLSNLSVAHLDESIDSKFIIKANERQKEIDPLIEMVSKQIKDRLCFAEAY